MFCVLCCSQIFLFPLCSHTVWYWLASMIAPNFFVYVNPNFHCHPSPPAPPRPPRMGSLLRRALCVALIAALVPAVPFLFALVGGGWIQFCPGPRLPSTAPVIPSSSRVASTAMLVVTVCHFFLNSFDETDRLPNSCLLPTQTAEQWSSNWSRFWKKVQLIGISFCLFLVCK